MAKAKWTAMEHRSFKAKRIWRWGRREYKIYPTSLPATRVLEQDVGRGLSFDLQPFDSLTGRNNLSVTAQKTTQETADLGAELSPPQPRIRTEDLQLGVVVISFDYPPHYPCSPEFSHRTEMAAYVI